MSEQGRLLLLFRRERLRLSVRLKRQKQKHLRLVGYTYEPNHLCILRGYRGGGTVRIGCRWYIIASWIKP